MADEDKYKLAAPEYQEQPEAAYKLAAPEYQLAQPEAAAPQSFEDFVKFQQSKDQATFLPHKPEVIPSYLDAAKSGVTGTAALGVDLAKKILPASIQTDIGIPHATALLERFGPAKGYQPQTAGEYGVQFASGLADIPGWLLGGQLTKVAAPVIKGVLPKLGTLGQQMTKNLEVAMAEKALGNIVATKAASDAAYKNHFARQVVEGLADNAVQGALTSGAQSYSQGDSFSDIALKSTLGGGLGGVLGGGLSAAGARLGKKNFTNIGKGFSEKVLDTRTPSIIALDEQFKNSLREAEINNIRGAIVATQADYPAVARMAPKDFEKNLTFQVVDSDGLNHQARNEIHAKDLATKIDGVIRFGLTDEKGNFIPITPIDETEPLTLLQKLRDSQSYSPGKEIETVMARTAKQEQMQTAKQTLQFRGRKVNTENIPGIYKQQTVSSATEQALLQAEKVRETGKKLGWSEETISKLAKADFDNALEKQMVPRTDGLDPVGEGTWRLGHEAASKIDQALGTNLSGAHLTVINARNAAKNLHQDFNLQDVTLIKQIAETGIGVDGEMPSIFRYIETDSATGQPFLNKNMSDNPLNIRPAYDGPELTPQQIDLFGQLRQVYDKKRATYAAQVGDIGYVPGYLHIMDREIKTGPKQSVEGTVTPKSAQSRQEGFWNPDYHETDMLKIANAYNQEISRAIALKPAIDEGLKQVQLLQLLEKPEAMAFWKRQMADAFGLKKTRDLEDMFGKAVYKDLEPQLIKIISKSDDPELIKGEFLREMSKAFYTNKVLLSPKNQMLQFFQPEFVGFGEIGPYATKGRFRDKETQAAVNEMLKVAYNAKTGGLQDFGGDKGPKGKAARALALINTPGKIIGGGVQNYSEKMNRQAILGGAYMQWRDAFNEQGIAGITPLLERLLPGQRASIERTFSEKGQEAAKRHYAIITSDRANFSYDIINRPQALRNEVGNNIPFLTFGLNSMERLATDLKGKQGKQLARRFAPALAFSYTVSKLSNDKREFKGADPLSSAVGVLNPNVNPAVSSMVDAYNRKGTLGAAQEAATNLTPIPKAIDLYQAAEKKKLGNATLDSFGFKKKKDDWYDSLVHALKRKLR